MLSFLRIRNLAIVKDLSLRWGEGLNLVTGETGAGKSLLVEGLGLALGDRALPDMVRAGGDRAEVEAVFLAGQGREDARAFLASVGIEPEGDEIVVRREIGEAARSRQFLCDRAVSLATLRRFGDLMVEIQGQHEHQALLSSEVQREALDRFAAIEAEGDTVAELAREANDAASSLASLETHLQERDARLDYVRFQLRELEELAPSESDEASLRADRILLRHASQRRELADRAYRRLYEDDASLLGGLAAARADLVRLAEIDPSSAGMAESSARAEDLLRDVAMALRDCRDRALGDPERLEAIEGRLALYERLARKHGGSAAGLAAKLEGLAAEARALEASEERAFAARERAQLLRARYCEAAQRLSGRRTEAARRLASALERELAALAMGSCKFEVGVHAEGPREGAPLALDGLDRIELRIAPNRGEPLRALTHIASGGELSRVMLALHGVVGERRRRRTLIFDEVDAGIGGRVAAVVGERLRDLAASHQVIVITHLPQIASLADRHFVAEKRVERGRTVSAVRELDREGRVAEIARMLGGRRESPLARRHAADMLRKTPGGPERRLS